MNYVISQILGYISLVLICASYFFKDKNKFLILEIVANVFYGSALLVLSAWSGGIVVCISTVRCIFLLICNKKNYKHTVKFLPIFFTAYLITGIVFWTAWYDILPIFIGSLFTIGFYIKNNILMRLVLIIPNTLSIIYDSIVQAHSNAILNVIEVSVIIVSLFKFIYLHYKEKREQIKSYQQDETKQLNEKTFYKVEE